MQWFAASDCRIPHNDKVSIRLNRTLHPHTYVI